MQARWLQRASSPGRKVSQSKTAHPAHRERRGSSRTAKCHDLFSDIKHFTGISEQLTASTIVHLLNEYFGAVAKVIHGHRGIVDKYIGDAVMAFWVPPFLAGDDRARDACAAALRSKRPLWRFKPGCPKSPACDAMRLRSWSGWVSPRAKRLLEPSDRNRQGPIRLSAIA